MNRFEDLKQALKASIEMTYATEMAVARKSYLGACVEVGLEAKEQDHFDLDAYPSNLEIKRNLEYALPPSKLSRIDEQRFEKYIKLDEKYPHLSRVVDEMLNLYIDWKSLDEIVDRIGFQFGIRDAVLLEGIADDLKDLGVIQTRDM